MHVDFYETMDSGDQKIICKAILKDSKVVFEGGSFRKYLNVGIRDVFSDNSSKTSPPKTVYPDDGIIFLKNLKYNYSGSRLRASDIIED